MHLLKNVRVILIYITTIAIVTLASCKVTTPYGTLEPADPPQGSSGCMPVKVGEREYRGKTYWLYDTDCDGDPDYVFDPESGLFYRKTENNDPILYSGVELQPLIEVVWAATKVPPSSANPSFMPADYQQVAPAPPLFNETREFSTPWAFDLTAYSSAGAWHQATGIGAGQFSFVQAELDLAADTWDDSYILWSSMYGRLPDLAQYDLAFEIRGVIDGNLELPSGPIFFVLRVGEGPITEAMRFVHDLMTSEEISIPNLEIEVSGSTPYSTTVGIVSNSGSEITSVYLSGETEPNWVYEW